MSARLSLFVLALAAPGAIMGAKIVAQTSSQCRAMYTVVQNDNCVDIAAEFNVPYATLLVANSVALDSNCDNLFIGQQLCIPTLCQAGNTVTSGDVCISNSIVVQSRALKSNIDQDPPEYK
ncbi:hypothetical protein EV360DRAFT_79912 [Lentinula raphanica]|nr:hypothetical protein EV360DRAFT_79912 [Lentinula raphanica]